jgi:hypothetical protein
MLLCVCVCAFSFHRESPDMILGDKPLISEVVLSQFLSQHSHWSSSLKPSICWWQTNRLTGPISLAYDQYVQYLFVGVNPSVLNRHRQGYNIGGASLPHHTSQPSQLIVLHFLSKGPVRSQVIHQTITNWTREGTNHKSREWDPSLDFYHNLSSMHSMS